MEPPRQGSHSPGATSDGRALHGIPQRTVARPASARCAGPRYTAAGAQYSDRRCPETKTQKQKGIQDSVDLFISDTLKGGAKKPEGLSRWR